MSVPSVAVWLLSFLTIIQQIETRGYLPKVYLFNDSAIDELVINPNSYSIPDEDTQWSHHESNDIREKSEINHVRSSISSKNQDYWVETNNDNDETPPAPVVNDNDNDQWPVFDEEPRGILDRIKSSHEFLKRAIQSQMSKIKCTTRSLVRIMSNRQPCWDRQYDVSKPKYRRINKFTPKNF
ncbi:uncharacterized protein LOC141853040 [Brevipalpus obovatus]|uniref:uncharacterized protein LOC141853040 n=1 Tax=Brevipalpus obovatus TaxID=246614 RepID=UPI003D9EE30E